MGSGCLFSCCEKGKYILNKGSKNVTTKPPQGSSKPAKDSPKPSKDVNETKLNGKPTVDNTSPGPSTQITPQTQPITTTTTTDKPATGTSKPRTVSFVDPVDIPSDNEAKSRKSSAASSLDLDETSEVRREGVRAEKVEFDEDRQLAKHAKNKDDELVIKNAISSNEFLRNVLKDDNLQDIIDAMYKKDVEPDEIIIMQGEKGMHLYVSASGTYEVIIKNKTEVTFKDQRVFGELAILYNAKRLATIKALTKGQLWVLDHQDYMQIVVKSDIKEQEEMYSFLKNVPILKEAGEGNLRLTANLLKKEFFKTDDVIVKEGDKGDKFYVIRAGTVSVSKEKEGKVATLIRGQFFGELALLGEDFRKATCTADSPGVECLSIDRKEFIEYLGGMEAWKENGGARDIEEETPVDPKYAGIKLEDLKREKTLGVGGFGRVELVSHKKDKRVFALKYLKKVEIIKLHQKEHAINEKRIQMSCNTMFIVRLYKTFKDDRYLFFLMESCLGGDLWTLLQKQKNKCFDENSSRFLAACVLEALAYLHKYDYIYRDLKPENLLVDADGYIKLTDFGFAKKLPLGNRTYTFAGTPEYVAPEIVLNRGHDRAIDYWALGIFIYELLVGKTPFRTNDPTYMRTYNLILSGLDNVTFPNKVNKVAQQLIRKLCKPKPTDRLGCQRNGAQDIRNHKWFADFAWQKLYDRKLTPPFVPKLKGPLDTQYFDKFEEDKDDPAPVQCEWDEDF